MLRDLPKNKAALQGKLQVCQISIYLILGTFGHKLRLRSPRITVLYLQGEGRYLTATGDFAFYFLSYLE